jgi:outer membrane protein assembly factor BamB
MAPRLRIALCVAAVSAFAATTSQAATSTNWGAFLAGPQHSSRSTDPTVTPATVAGLTQAWSWKPPVISGRPPSQLFSTPDVVDGTVYEAGHNGVFYALSLATGKVLWANDLKAYQPKLTCGAQGFIASPAAATDPTTGQLTIYDAGGDGYLYALDAATGAVRWKVATMLPSATKNDYMNWSSPTIANGSIYLGIASSCDNPLVPGKLMKFSQATGALQATYNAMAGTPAGTPGATIWSTAAANSTDVWVTTGNAKSSKSPQGDSDSIVDLNASTLAKKAIWTLPNAQQVSDGDFGASPVVFTAKIGGVSTKLVGACNKNGQFYAVNAKTMKLVWQFKVDTVRGACMAGAIWDGSHLFVAGNPTKIGSTSYPGSIRELNPATGAPIWQTGLAAGVVGTPTESGGGVIAVATWDPTNPNALYFLDPATGAVLRTIPQTVKEFAQPVFADGYLVTATLNGGLIAYH